MDMMIGLGRELGSVVDSSLGWVVVSVGLGVVVGLGD